MRHVRTERFKNDYRRLSDREKEMFRAAALVFSAACDAFRGSPSVAFPANLRVKSVQGADGVFEMTWSFAGPDGRATWEWVTVDVVEPKGTVMTYPAVQWRRIGGHDVFRNP